MPIDQKTFMDVIAAPQDISTSVLQELLDAGYDMTTWHTSSAAVDAPCISKNGDMEPLADFLANLQHNAPIYEKTHVGCKCTVTVTGPGDLPPVEVGAFGALNRIKPKPKKPVKKVVAPVVKKAPPKAVPKALAPAPKPAAPKTPAKPEPKVVPKPVPKPTGGREARQGRAAR
jgi:hypothetical protein